MTTVAKNRRILNEYGVFESYREDTEASQRALDSAGTTRDDVERERKYKSIEGANMTKENKEAAMAESLGDNAFEKEMERRGLSSSPVKATPKASGIPSYKNVTIAKIKELLESKGINYSSDVVEKKDLYTILENDGKIGSESLDEDDL